MSAFTENNVVVSRTEADRVAFMQRVYDAVVERDAGAQLFCRRAPTADKVAIMLSNFTVVTVLDEFTFYEVKNSNGATNVFPLSVMAEVIANVAIHNGEFTLRLSLVGDHIEMVFHHRAGGGTIKHECKQVLATDGQCLDSILFPDHAAYSIRWLLDGPVTLTAVGPAPDFQFQICREGVLNKGTNVLRRLLEMTDQLNAAAAAATATAV
jgi:hypothetical protein